MKLDKIPINSSKYVPMNSVVWDEWYHSEQLSYLNRLQKCCAISIINKLEFYFQYMKYSACDENRIISFLVSVFEHINSKSIFESIEKRIVEVANKIYEDGNDNYSPGLVFRLASELIEEYTKELILEFEHTEIERYGTIKLTYEKN